MIGRFAVAVGLVALALAWTSGGAGAVSSSPHPGSRTGTIAGRVQLAGVERGIARLFTARHRLVAQRDLQGHGHFRFILKPGRYELRIAFSPVNACPQKIAVRVQANRTSRIMLAEACVG
jgi:hypothetical protein